MKKLFFPIILLGLWITLDVNAACDLRELESLANKVKITYNLVEKDYYYFDLYFNNLHDDIFLSSIGFGQGDIKKPEDSTTYIEQVYGIDNIIKNKFLVYATDGSCQGGALREIELTLPKYNEMSNTPICKNNPNYHLCKKLLFTDNNISYLELASKIEETLPKEIKVIEKDVVNNNIYYYIAAGAGIIIIAGIIYAIWKKKSKGRI